MSLSLNAEQGRTLPIVCGEISPIRYGLVVRIAGSHPAGPGSIPGTGTESFFVIFPVAMMS